MIEKGTEFTIQVEAKNTDSILYFITNSQGDMISSQSIDIVKDKVDIYIDSKNSEKFQVGTGNVKIFAVSESVLKPDFYETSFVVTEVKTKLPNDFSKEIEFSEKTSSYEIWIIPIIVIIGIIILIKKRYNKP